MRHRGLHGLGIDLDTAAVVDRDPRCAEIEILDGTDAAGGKQQHLGGDAAAIGEFGRHLAVGPEFDRRQRRAEPQRDVAVAQVMDEFLDQFAIDEIEESRTRLDQRHRDVERVKDRRVFDADDTGADDGQAARQLGKFDDVVAIEHGGAVERHIVGPKRFGAAGDQNVRSLVDVGVAVLVGHLNVVRRGKAPRSAGGLDAIAAELMLENLDLVVERLAQAPDQIGRGNVLLDPVGPAVKPALAPA